MAVHAIAYAELYTTDPEATTDWFVTAFGFTRTAEAVRDDARSVLLTHGDVRIVVTSGPVTTAFLDAHGDGIADIALTSDDIEGDARRAGSAGRSFRGDPTVPGFGDVVHSLVPVRAAGTLPGTVGWTPLPAGPDATPARMLLLDHVAICLPGGTLQAQADHYRDTLGLNRFYSEYVEVGDQAMDSQVVRSESGGITFTLVAPEPGSAPGQLDAFLTRNAGPGVQHLAFLVDEIVPAVREYSGRGVRFLTAPESYYDALADRFQGMAEGIGQLRETNVLADRDEWGYLLQLFTRSPHERKTLFYELIQRRGSRGFGSSNIRALYEAVERDRLAAR